MILPVVYLVLVFFFLIHMCIQCLGSVIEIHKLFFTGNMIRFELAIFQIQPWVISKATNTQDPYIR
jgi:hypothetical protein